MAQRRDPAGRALLSYVAGATLGQKHADQFGLVGPMQGRACCRASSAGGADLLESITLLPQSGARIFAARLFVSTHPSSNSGPNLSKTSGHSPRRLLGSPP